MSQIAVKSAFATNLPRWQVLLVLVGFPLAYLINNFMPWSMGLFFHQDRSWYFPFFISTMALHWTTLVITVLLVRRAGGSLADIGLAVSPAKVAIALAVFAAWGAALLWYRSTWPESTEQPTGYQLFYPFTFSERILMLLVATTAGICEETIYRGFAIKVLQGRGWKLWLALLLAGLSFAGIHGVTGIVLAPMFVIVALVFSAIFLWRGSLWPVIYLHVLWDMMMVLPF